MCVYTELMSHNRLLWKLLVCLRCLISIWWQHSVCCLQSNSIKYSFQRFHYGAKNGSSRVLPTFQHAIEQMNPLLWNLGSNSRPRSRTQKRWWYVSYCPPHFLLLDNHCRDADSETDTQIIWLQASSLGKGLPTVWSVAQWRTVHHSSNKMTEKNHPNHIFVI